MNALKVVSALPPEYIHASENLGDIEKIGCGLATLADLLRCSGDDITDQEFFKDGLSYLIGALAGSLLDKSVETQAIVFKLTQKRSQ